ncbi:hypothetical protein CRG98_002941 [Punica granatum]|uniref:Uncharacterized protein n=1 Tax=Punica granatum TaxID=22663 RepID=A0A2I0L7G1_PUNGR|nr:hypothetical protein CRG98_002941 [Punica granatum]
MAPPVSSFLSLPLTSVSAPKSCCCGARAVVEQKADSMSQCIQLVWVQLADDDDCLNSSSTMTLMMGGYVGFNWFGFNWLHPSGSMGGCIEDRKDDVGGATSASTLSDGPNEDVTYGIRADSGPQRCGITDGCFRLYPQARIDGSYVLDPVQEPN